MALGPDGRARAPGGRARRSGSTPSTASRPARLHAAKRRRRSAASRPTSRRFPSPRASFDLAVFNASLHYATDLANVLADARRVVRPGGRSRFSTPRSTGARKRARRWCAEGAADRARRFPTSPTDFSRSARSSTSPAARLAAAAVPFGLRFRRLRVLYPLGVRAARPACAPLSRAAAVAIRPLGRRPYDEPPRDPPRQPAGHEAEEPAFPALPDGARRRPAPRGRPGRSSTGISRTRIPLAEASAEIEARAGARPIPSPRGDDRHAGAAAGRGGSDREAPEGALPRRPDRLGRLLSDALPRARA